jgi:predicted esterase
MDSQEKEISYTTTNSYSTLNKLTKSTKNVWFICHGMGYLSRYFLKYFKTLNSEENYFIAPQAPSKYYLKSNFKYVGSCWLTKENTFKDTENVMHYFDSIFENEKIPQHTNLIIFGYSQGVSVSMRYVVKRKINCTKLILHSGGIPTELGTNDFSFLKAQVKLICGNKDPFLNEKRLQSEIKKAQQLFENQLEVIIFNGKHEVNVEIIKGLV